MSNLQSIGFAGACFKTVEVTPAQPFIARITSPPPKMELRVLFMGFCIRTLLYTSVIVHMCTGKSFMVCCMRAAPGKFHKNLAKNLKRIRGDLSQPTFARKIGLTHATINRIEQHKQNVTIATLELICKAMKCSPNDLLGD